MRWRRREDHDPAQDGEQADGGARYLMREKLLSLGDDFWIENDRGERIFHVDDTVLRGRDTVVSEDPDAKVRGGRAPVVIKDRDGNELVKLQKRLLRARDTMAIERGGDKLATVKKAIIAALRDRFTITLRES